MSGYKLFSVCFIAVIYVVSLYRLYKVRVEQHDEFDLDPDFFKGILFAPMTVVYVIVLLLILFL